MELQNDGRKVAHVDLNDKSTQLQRCLNHQNFKGL